MRARDGVEATLVLFRRHADRDALGFGVSDEEVYMTGSATRNASFMLMEESSRLVT